MNSKALLAASGDDGNFCSNGMRVYRHASDMGSVIIFNDGQIRNILVFDAAYRTRNINFFTSYRGDPGWYYNGNFGSSLGSYSQDNAEGNSGIAGVADFTSPADVICMTDKQLAAIWPNTIDSRTGKQNCDLWLQCNPAPYAVQQARKVKLPDGTSANLPNIQTLMRMFVLGPKIDSLDKTLSQNPNVSLTKWFDDGYGRVFAWSSTRFYGDVYIDEHHYAKEVRTCALGLFCGGAVGNGFYFNSFKGCIAPVLEL